MENVYSSINQNNLLIIDDEVEITKSLQRQFRKKYNIYLANSAGEAFKIMHKNNINVIISDQRMPEITGVEFFSQIKNEFPDVVRLILTGYTDVEVIVRAINDGNIFRYISKPWNPDELDSILNEAFEKYYLIAQNKQLIKKLEISNESLEANVIKRTAELNDANQKLKEINATKDKFFSIIAHDLRNPFVTILGFSEMLINRFNTFSQNKVEKYLNNIYTSSKQTFELLENLLLWAGSQKGSLEFYPEKINMNTLMDENIALVEKQSSNKKIRILKEIEDNFEVTVDINMMNTIIRNLLTNAIKYSYIGGKIGIKAEAKLNFIQVSIADTGTGMSSLTLDNLFRIDVNTVENGTENEKGSGLGLILCKEFIEKHQGQIWVESKINEGSTFYFKIPK